MTKRKADRAPRVHPVLVNFYADIAESGLPETLEDMKSLYRNKPDPNASDYNQWLHKTNRLWDLLSKQAKMVSGAIHPKGENKMDEKMAMEQIQQRIRRVLDGLQTTGGQAESPSVD